MKLSMAVLAKQTKILGARAKLSQRPAHLSQLTLLLPQTTLQAWLPQDPYA